MSAQNRADGQKCYATGDAEIRAWFEHQWEIWPDRAHYDRTTNLSFHRGGVLAFREMHGRDPKMSRDFQSNVQWLDRDADTPKPPAQE